MNDEIPAIPEPEITESSYVFRVPHILIESPDGHITLREGGTRDVIRKVEIWFTEEQQPDEDVFKIKSECSVLFGGHTVSALTDAGTHNGRRMISSVPSAQEYLSLVGKPVNLVWKSDKVNTDSPWYRHFKRATIYRNERISINALP